MSQSKAGGLGSHIFLYSFLFGMIIFLVNYVSSGHYKLFDLTPQKQYSLSSQTVKVLKSLDEKVTVIAFMKAGTDMRASVKRLLEEYSYHSDKLEWEFVDPDKKPELSAKYGVNSYNSFVVVSFSDKREMFNGVMNEDQLTNAVIRASSENENVAYFTTGHGEKDLESKEITGYAEFAKALRAENFRVERLLLANHKSVPKDATLLIIAGPTKDFLAREISTLRRYLNSGGGKLLFMADPLTKSNAISLLSEYGITAMDDVIVDNLSRSLGGNYTTPAVATYNGSHEITKDFKIITLYPIARSLKVDKGEGLQVLASTFKESWGETDKAGIEKGVAQFDPKEDNNGPLAIAAVADIASESGAAKSRLVVFGDSDFVGNSFIGQNGNRDLIMNTVNSLAGERERIAIRPRDIEMEPLVFSENEIYAIGAISAIGIPLFVAVTGIAVNRRRKRS